LHVGHIAYLEAASKLGDLIVQVAPDEALLAKGRATFQSQLERARTVGALGCVRVAATHKSLVDAIRYQLPRVLVKGRDWLGKLPQDVVEACREVGTVIVYTDTQERTSTQRLFTHSTGPTVQLDLDPKFFQTDKKFYRPGFYRGDPGDENDRKGFDWDPENHAWVKI